jgi:dolichol kinase
MIRVILIILIAIIFSAAAEVISKKHHLRPELSRKIIHITGGTAAAFTPWYLSWEQIEILAVIMFAILLIFRYFGFFKSSRSVKRVSLGELMFAACIGIVAVITHDRLVFVAAVLQMGIADGLAAVFGSAYGKSSGYKVFGRQKSLIGSGVFYLCSFLILDWYLLAAHMSGNWTVIIWLPLVATGLEAIGLDGTDNLIVPAFVALILNRL